MDPLSSDSDDDLFGVSQLADASQHDAVVPVATIAAAAAAAAAAAVPHLPSVRKNAEVLKLDPD